MKCIIKLCDSLQTIPAAGYMCLNVCIHLIRKQKKNNDDVYFTPTFKKPQRKRKIETHIFVVNCVRNALYDVISFFFVNLLCFYIVPSSIHRWHITLKILVLSMSLITPISNFWKKKIFHFVLFSFFWSIFKISSALFSIRFFFCKLKYYIFFSLFIQSW